MCVRKRVTGIRVLYINVLILYMLCTRQTITLSFFLEVQRTVERQLYSHIWLALIVFLLNNYARLAVVTPKAKLSMPLCRSLTSQPSQVFILQFIFIVNYLKEMKALLQKTLVNQVTRRQTRIN